MARAGAVFQRDGRLWPAADAVPRLEETPIDGWVLAFTLGISAGAGIVFGIGPAIALWRSNLHGALKESARTSASALGLRVRRLLVAAEFALAVVLLTGAGLMLKSFWLMNAHPPGFSPESVLLIKVRPRYTTKDAQTAYLRGLVQRLESAPQVDAAGISMLIVFSGVPAFPNDRAVEFCFPWIPEDYADNPGQRTLAHGYRPREHDSAE
jgi:hypothetical protein